jgi:antitoxin component of MazEF toxin-antitoxin module
VSLKLPHTSFFSQTRKVTKQGTSYGVTLPADYIKSLETLDEKNLKMLNLNNQYIVYFAKKMSVNDSYDLLQLALSVLEALYILEEDRENKKTIERAYETLANLQGFEQHEMR